MMDWLKNIYQRLAARRVFDHWSETYEEDVRGNQYSAAKAVQAALAPYLREDSAIIDLGIGTGLIWQDIAIPDGCGIAGLDISPAMLEQASSLPDVGPLYLCDIGRHAWPFYEETQDLVVAAGLFEYLTEPMARHVFSEARRVLKSDGAFIFTYIPAPRNHTALWDGRSGKILSCHYDPEWIVQQPGFTPVRHDAPFTGSRYGDGHSYDYRLAILTKRA